jgi:hypothetical protein
MNPPAAALPEVSTAAFALVTGRFGAGKIGADFVVPEDPGGNLFCVVTKPEEQ